MTRNFRETVKARAEADPAFRAGLYQEAVQALLDGDLAAGRVLLRQVINATNRLCWFSETSCGSEKSLMRMFGEAGNPKADNLLAVLQALKEECRLSLTVEAKPARARRSAAGAHVP